MAHFSAMRREEAASSNGQDTALSRLRWEFDSPHCFQSWDEIGRGSVRTPKHGNPPTTVKPAQKPFHGLLCKCLTIRGHNINSLAAHKQVFLGRPTAWLKSGSERDGCSTLRISDILWFIDRQPAYGLSTLKAEPVTAANTPYGRLIANDL